MSPSAHSHAGGVTPIPTCVPENTTLPVSIGEVIIRSLLTTLLVEISHVEAFPEFSLSFASVATTSSFVAGVEVPIPTFPPFPFIYKCDVIAPLDIV